MDQPPNMQPIPGKQNVYTTLEERGLIDAVTSPHLRELLKEPITLYHGIDPSADSLHLGNLVGLIVLAHFQRAGHKVIALVGGATGFIGDPSGRSEERTLLTPETLQVNLAGIRRDLMAVLGTGSLSASTLAASTLVLNNYDWFKDLTFIDFLREVGKHFRMGSMLGKEMVRNRLSSSEGISFTEFSYQLLQAYDFLYLYDTYNCSLELGGSDQWGNITAGIELVRKARGATTYGLTWPLLLRSDGKKFGKSESGAVWLSKEKLSPYEFYQYLVRVPDLDVIGLMQKLTFIPMEEIKEWERRMGEPSYPPNEAQKRLAAELTELVHGEEARELAVRVTEGVSPGGRAKILTREALSELAQHMPTHDLPLHAVVDQKLIDLLVATHLLASKGEARRLIRGGGLSLNESLIDDEERVVRQEDLIEGELLLLRLGKKRAVLIRVG